MNAAIAWTACGCLAAGWVPGFLLGKAESGDPERERTQRLLREALLEEASDLAEFEEAATGTDRAPAGGPDRSRERVPVGPRASSSVLT